MSVLPAFAKPYTTFETKPCACCSREVDCGEYGDDRDGFDAEILLTEGAMVCLACAPEWIAESLEAGRDFDALRRHWASSSVYL